ncbi:MAG: endogenous inhibitor of DNA gyrase (YacG/DUF329 family) [Bradymonadia bacterium]|jgi:endogenous inhibitor of DNA gyrase (YacG/DUF329 family)
MLDGIRCSTCKGPVDMPPGNLAFPFCGQRCKMVDLGRWMEGEYALDPATGKLDVIDPDKAEEVSLDKGN